MFTKSRPVGARFSKAPEIFRAYKAIFCSSVCKNGEVHTPETSRYEVNLSSYQENVNEAAL